VKVGEQNLYTRAKELVGDRDPREHEFSIQMRAMDSDKTGGGVAIAGAGVALCGSLLGKNTRGGTIVVGALNLGGSIEPIPNAVRIAELAVDKQAQTLLMPVSARRQLNDLPDDLWTRISIEFYKDAPTRCSRRWWSSFTHSQWSHSVLANPRLSSSRARRQINVLSHTGFDLNAVSRHK
jgi:ATP-dependent Lon protease